MRARVLFDKNKKVHLKQEKEETAIMKILIAGATGFIGSSLVSSFSDEFEITVLGRDMDHLKRRFPQHHAVDWKGLKSESATDYQIVINLCGENIADKRWTSEQKTKILQSRVETTDQLASWALNSSSPQSLRFLNASAVGISGLNTIKNTEKTPITLQENCFSQQVVRVWESTVQKKLENKINYTLMRFGVVLKKQHGMLKKLKMPYQLGLASILGSGQQQISWIHIEDLVRAIRLIIKTPSISGPINMVAPEVVTQKQLAKNLAKALNRPCFLQTPIFFIKLLFGQMGEELLLSGQEVIPEYLQKANFFFQYPMLEKAIFHEHD